MNKLGCDHCEGCATYGRGLKPLWHNGYDDLREGARVGHLLLEKKDKYVNPWPSPLCLLARIPSHPRTLAQILESTVPQRIPGAMVGSPMVAMVAQKLPNWVSA